MTNLMLIEELSQIARKFEIDLGHAQIKQSIDESIYYPQIEAELRNEARMMSSHYEVFYSLEKSIRKLVSETLAEAQGSQNWWNGPRVTENIKVEVKTRISKELDAGVTRRSLNELDYSTFGELGVLITSNWDVFGSIFNSKKAVEKIMANLNALRNPIAHCCPLAEDEILRLQLTVRDWFRLME